MEPQAYDKWYQSPRGAWSGGCETALMLASLQPRPAESSLDVGCGTGNFARALSAATDGRAIGIDIDSERVAWAYEQEARAAGGPGHGAVRYAVADARELPFADRSVDLVVCIAALCFVDDEATAVREMVRVARRRVALGLLNRRSLLWLRRGRHGGSGGLRGARWHTVDDALGLFDGLPVRDVQVRTAIQVPGGGRIARIVERLIPATWTHGGFLLVAAGLDPPADTTVSMRFFDEQFRRQVAGRDLALNPFEQIALPYVHGRVLDFGCGLGNLSVAAAERGCTVRALDASPTAIEHLRKVAASRALSIEAARADLRDHRLDGEFDTIVCIGLLMFFDRDTALRQLRGLQSRLRAGGTAVINLLIDGTTFLDMFEPSQHCLLTPEEARSVFVGWDILYDDVRGFPAPGGRTKLFLTLVARKPLTTAG